jgi:hypothetical protein
VAPSEAALATEAFDLAGDPLAFPEQLEAPRDPLQISNYGEGLSPWQPQKIYYLSDYSFSHGTHPDFMGARDRNIAMMRFLLAKISPTRS